MPGFPIRKSSDLSSVDSSPRLIAASYVLHRLLVPRHPPCAFNNLTTKMLASTVQFSKYGRTQPTITAYPTPPTNRDSADGSTAELARRRHPTQKRRLFPQDPTAYHSHPLPTPPVPTPTTHRRRSERLNRRAPSCTRHSNKHRDRIASVPPMSTRHRHIRPGNGPGPTTTPTGADRPARCSLERR